MTAEVFPNRLRAAATMSNRSASLLISVTFLTLISAIGKSWTFWLYAIFAGLAIVFVARCVPETRGRPLEHIDEYRSNGRRWPTGDRAAAGTTRPAAG
jgi:MFS transporter, SP family, galactose:H+ symporter